VEVDDLFERVRLSFDALARQRHIDLIMDVAPDLPATIPGDSDRLRDQVLGNILSNAIKFTPEEGTVTLRVRAGARLEVEVEDTGPGIPPDQLPHIFDKYFPVGDHARSKGAGLGLAIAREIVDAHGGRIHALSAPGGGTTVCIQLPLHAVIPEPETATSMA
jgi:signal transduction histidine kinase